MLNCWKHAQKFSNFYVVLLLLLLLLRGLLLLSRTAARPLDIERIVWISSSGRKLVVAGQTCPYGWHIKTHSVWNRRMGSASFYAKRNRFDFYGITMELDFSVVIQRQHLHELSGVCLPLLFILPIHRSLSRLCKWLVWERSVFNKAPPIGRSPQFPTQWMHKNISLWLLSLFVVHFLSAAGSLLNLRFSTFGKDHRIKWSSVLVATAAIILTSMPRSIDAFLFDISPEKSLRERLRGMRTKEKGPF